MSKFKDALIAMIREGISENLTNTAWYYKDSISEAPVGGTYKLKSGKLAKALSKASFEVGEPVLVIRTIDGNLWLYKPIFRRALQAVSIETTDMPIDLVGGGFPTYYTFAPTKLTVSHLFSGTAQLEFPFSAASYLTSINGIAKDDSYASGLKFALATMPSATKTSPTQYTASYTIYDMVISGLSTLKSKFAQLAKANPVTLPVTGTISASVFSNSGVTTSISHPNMDIARLATATGTWFVNPFDSCDLFYVRYRTYDTSDYLLVQSTIHRDIYIGAAQKYQEAGTGAAFTTNLTIEAFDAQGVVFTKGASRFYNSIELPPNVSGSASTQSGVVYVPSGIWTTESGFQLTSATTSSYKGKDFSGYAAVSNRLLSSGNSTSVSGTVTDGSVAVELSMGIRRRTSHFQLPTTLIFDLSPYLKINGAIKSIAKGIYIIAQVGPVPYVRRDGVASGYRSFTGVIENNTPNTVTVQVTNYDVKLTENYHGNYYYAFGDASTSVAGTVPPFSSGTITAELSIGPAAPDYTFYFTDPPRNFTWCYPHVGLGGTITYILS